MLDIVHKMVIVKLQKYVVKKSKWEIFFESLHDIANDTEMNVIDNKHNDLCQYAIPR